jgi:GGDEF domain-containing protein
LRSRTATARRIVAVLRRPVVIDGRELVVTASVGISIYPDDSQEASTLIRTPTSPCIGPG